MSVGRDHPAADPPLRYRGGDGADHVLRPGIRHLPEDRVVPVQVRRRSQGDEELGTGAVSAEVRHGQSNRPIDPPTGTDLVRYPVSGASVAGAPPVAALD